MNPRILGGVVASLLVLTGALPAALGADTEVQVANVAPTVTSVTLPGSSISPTSGATTAVSTTVVVADLNGYNDIASVTVEVLKPDGSTSHRAASAATFSTGSATSATYTYSFTMDFHDDPALSADTYKVKVVVTDSQGASGNNVADLALFNYAQLAALNLNQSAFDMGSSLQPGSQSSVFNLGVQNYGNVAIDLQLSGTNMTHGTEAASIGVANMAYSTASNMTGSGNLGLSAATLGTFDLAKGASSSKSLYWQLTVPSGSDQWVPSGTYTGSVTVAAVAG